MTAEPNITPINQTSWAPSPAQVKVLRLVAEGMSSKASGVLRAVPYPVLRLRGPVPSYHRPGRTHVVNRGRFGRMEDPSIPDLPQPGDQALQQMKRYLIFSTAPNAKSYLEYTATSPAEAVLMFQQDRRDATTTVVQVYEAVEWREAVAVAGGPA